MKVHTVVHRGVPASSPHLPSELAAAEPDNSRQGKHGRGVGARAWAVVVEEDAVSSGSTWSATTPDRAHPPLCRRLVQRKEESQPCAREEAGTHKFQGWVNGGGKDAPVPQRRKKHMVAEGAIAHQPTWLLMDVGYVGLTHTRDTIDASARPRAPGTTLRMSNHASRKMGAETASARICSGAGAQRLSRRASRESPRKRRVCGGASGARKAGKLRQRRAAP